jgi:hypothetical protein
VIVEERIYTIQPERMKEYLALYESEGLPIQSRILRMLGYFQTEIGVLNQVVHLWAYDSMEDRSLRRAELQAAPGWKDYAAKAKPFYVGQECRIMKALPWSPVP